MRTILVILLAFERLDMQKEFFGISLDTEIRILLEVKQLPVYAFN
jgi:hypothetical protein